MLDPAACAAGEITKELKAAAAVSSMQRHVAFFMILLLKVR
jgi:hypothetical protein